MLRDWRPSAACQHGSATLRPVGAVRMQLSIYVLGYLVLSLMLAAGIGLVAVL